MILRLARFTILAVVALLLCCGVMLLAASPSLAQSVVYVDEDAGGANDGTSWADAFTDLQDALSASQNEDEIWVAEGTYTPITSDSPSSTERGVSFELVDGVGVYGGFDGTEDAREERDPEPGSNGTVLSGEIGDQSIVTDNSYNVVSSGSVSETTILDGFTVTGGFANANSTVRGRGGGLYNGDGSPRLQNLIFEGNTARSFGGGLHNESGSLELSSVVFSNNEVTASFGDGGGMSSNQNSEATLTDVSFTANSAVRNGGGLYSERSNLSLTDVAFEENEAATGGGMYNDRGNVTVENGGFEGNTATGSGGGAYNTGNSTGGDFRFTGVSFMENVAGDGGGMFSFGDGSNPTANTMIMDSTFAQNEAGNSGGGMANSNSNSSVTDTTFSGNIATNGGGVRNVESSPSFMNVEFLDNSAVANEEGDEADAGSGGGVSNQYSDPTITNALFSGNSATDGGAMHNFGSSPTITNSTFSENTATGGEGGVFNLRESGEETRPSSPAIQNSILWNNEAGSGEAGSGEGEISNDGGTPTVRHSIVRGGLPDGTTDGGNNLDEDPSFADPESGDFRLRPGSPGINRGSNDLVPQDANTDLDGNPRIFDGKIVDLGAYEFQANQAPVADFRSLGTSEDMDLTITLAGSDLDGDALSFEIQGGPLDGSLSETGPVVCSGRVPNECEVEVTYTPDPDYSGSDSFTYKVNDGTEDSETATVDISINPVNDAPTVGLDGDREAGEGETVFYTFTVADPDEGDSFEVSGGFPNCGDGGVFVSGSLQTDSGGGSFDCSFPDGPAQTVVSLQVQDSAGAESNVAELTVGVSNVKPGISLSGPNLADEGDTEEYAFTVTDPGDDAQTVVATCGENAEKVADSDAFDEQTGEGSFGCLFPDGPAITTVSVESSDGNETGRAEKTVEISNIAPEVEGLSGRGGVRNGPVYTYTFAVTEPGDDDIVYAGGYPDCGENARLVGEPKSRSFQCRFTGNGSSVVSVGVEDSDGAASNIASRRVEIAPSIKSPCTIKGTGRRDVLRGTSGDDVICGLGGDDVIRGLGGDDVIKGGGGRDVIYGGPGDDLLFGGAGNDALFGGAGKDRMVGGPGKNRLKQ